MRLFLFKNSPQNGLTLDKRLPVISNKSSSDRNPFQSLANKELGVLFVYRDPFK